MKESHFNLDKSRSDKLDFEIWVRLSLVGIGLSLIWVWFKFDLVLVEFG